MSSELKANKISPATGTATTLGDSGDVSSYGSGAGGLGGLASVQTFTTSGTWTKPTGVQKVIIEVQGAGGGGSQNASQNTRCISGGGGGYAKKFLDVSSISTSTITVGAAGTGGTAAVGTIGGDSSWADGTNTITGAAATTAAAINDTNQVFDGGAATNGDINIPGAKGGPSTGDTGGWRADSLFGFGGGFASTGHFADGENDAVGYGSGGGGSGDYRGGNGAPGIVVVWEYK